MKAKPRVGGVLAGLSKVQKLLDAFDLSCTGQLKYTSSCGVDLTLSFPCQVRARCQP